ncbi:SKU5 similar 13, partial [Zea mays]
EASPVIPRPPPDHYHHPGRLPWPPHRISSISPQQLLITILQGSSSTSASSRRRGRCATSTTCPTTPSAAARSWGCRCRHPTPPRAKDDEGAVFTSCSDHPV